MRGWPVQEDQADAQLSHEHGPQLRRGAARSRFDPAYGQTQGGHAGELDTGRCCNYPGGGFGGRGQAKVSRWLESAPALYADCSPAEVRFSQMKEPAVAEPLNHEVWTAGDLLGKLEGRKKFFVLDV